MKRLQNFEQFSINEYSKWSNLRKGAAMSALGTGLALSSPEASARQMQTNPTRIEQSKVNEFSKVIERPGKTANDIKIEIYRAIEDHRASRASSVIRGISYLPSTNNEIFVKVHFAVMPKGIKGLTVASVRFIIKDDKFKIVINDLEFENAQIVDRELETELRYRFAPVVGSTIGGIATRNARGRAGGVASILANIAASSIQDLMIRNAGKPKNKDFRIGDDKPKSLSKKAYEGYLNDLEKACNQFFDLFSSTSSSEESDDF